MSAIAKSGDNPPPITTAIALASALFGILLEVMISTPPRFVAEHLAVIYS
jgi:hypothetical protein